MIRAISGYVIAGVVLSAGLARAQDPIDVPSGQTITFFEQRVDEGADIVRLRFIAPDLVSPLKRPNFEDMTIDLEALCNDYGLSNLFENSTNPKQIVISLSSEPVEFGVANSEIEQVFEAFSVKDDTCMLEMF
jgi:hypothetical protein